MINYDCSCYVSDIRIYYTITYYITENISAYKLMKLTFFLFLDFVEVLLEFLTSTIQKMIGATICTLKNHNAILQRKKNENRDGSVTRI